MRPRVERTPQARRDLEEIADYIARDNVEAAFRFYNAAESSFEKLARMPRMGAIRRFVNPRLGLVRMWPIPSFKNYLVFYRPTDNGVEILRVLHRARNIQSLFTDRE